MTHRCCWTARSASTGRGVKLQGAVDPKLAPATLLESGGMVEMFVPFQRLSDAYVHVRAAIFRCRYWASRRPMNPRSAAHSRRQRARRELKLSLMAHRLRGGMKPRPEIRGTAHGTGRRRRWRRADGHRRRARCSRCCAHVGERGHKRRRCTGPRLARRCRARLPASPVASTGRNNSGARRLVCVNRQKTRVRPHRGCREVRGMILEVTVTFESDCHLSTRNFASITPEGIAHQAVE